MSFPKPQTPNPRLQIAIQMDSLESINPRSDTTLCIAREAQARGHALWHYTPNRLSWRDGKVTARANRVTFHEGSAPFYTLATEEQLDVGTMDVVLLRQDPPFDMAYITTTYLLERLTPKTCVVNNPKAVRDFPEKWLPTCFAEFMPPTLIASDVQDILAFRKAHHDVVIKPFYGYGGHDIFRLAPDTKDAQAMLEKALPTTKEPVMVQKFLPEVKDQDRRIILIDGELCGLFGRIPAEGEIRANIVQGGTPVKADITPRQREICDAVGPMLKAQGLLLAGLDTIGDWLTEINITSPTGFMALKNLYGTTPEKTFWDAVEKKL